MQAHAALQREAANLPILPVAQRWGGGRSAKRMVEGQRRRVHGPFVNAAPKARFILSACKTVEGRRHLPRLRRSEDYSASPPARFAFRRCRHDGAFFTAATPSAAAGVGGIAGTGSPRASAASIHAR
jgi:hypothetical protein